MTSHIPTTKERITALGQRYANHSSAEAHHSGERAQIVVELHDVLGVPWHIIATITGHKSTSGVRKLYARGVKQAGGERYPDGSHLLQPDTLQVTYPPFDPSRTPNLAAADQTFRELLECVRTDDLGWRSEPGSARRAACNLIKLLEAANASGRTHDCTKAEAKPAVGPVRAFLNKRAA